MGMFSLPGQVFTVIFCALVLRLSVAEQEHFPQLRNLTWAEARNHCQVCFKELVTLTPDNIKPITQKITSESWIGLRKNFSSTSSPGMLWTHWANGDPLTFQNWYPGWPVFKSPLPKLDCCSCSCTCPAVPTSVAVTDSTAWVNSTIESSTVFATTETMMTRAQPLEAECQRSPMPLPVVPKSDVKYIEDSCVAMLRFGAWVEKNCSELLPFVCYEDRFFGKANVTDVTSDSATVSWEPGPGNIDRYRVEVNKASLSTNNLTYDLSSLTAGTLYVVQVFAVKCERDLNPQEVRFYTKPYKVQDLKCTNLTESSVTLSWNKPGGNVDFYRIVIDSGKIQSNTLRFTEGTEVHGLMPGSLYTFSVSSGVNDSSQWSEESSITVYTNPGKVSNLMVSDNTNNSLVLNWEPPNGNHMGFQVQALNDNNEILFKKVVALAQHRVDVTNLPMGTRMTLSVAALVNGTQEGDRVTTVSYTAPGPISGLNLTTTHISLCAVWIPPPGNYSCFLIELKLDGNAVKTSNTTIPEMCFDSLKTAANYTVTVYSISGALRGPPVSSSKFTKPSPPTDPRVSVFNESHIEFRWSAPVNTITVVYSVRVNSSFWGQTWSATVNNTTSCTFGNLKSGTKYQFEVRTVAGQEESDPATIAGFTKEKKREVSFSMLCSSAEPLLCANNTTKDAVFQQLHAHFTRLLGDGVFWELEEQESENKAA
ncbi:receptor-type tyrosine-protein phosphatase eta [Mastacembelus armatus]|uniref:receptor-type tyrosine-protein phosphatase eta n=1 Tax=Mastacembelus armatus TaxID=205130 RepID=UPI000E45F9BE|nr:receptor-type tyrosine-protein phosphatase eta-like [Mastacembelus armatus]